MALTSIANIEARMGTLSDSQKDYFVNVLSPAIDRFIEQNTEMQFGSTTDTTIYISGQDSKTLIIPTMHSITSIATVDADGVESVLDPTSYTKYPFSATEWYALRNRSGSFYEGFDNYKLVGKMGYAEAPADIIMVATELAVNELTRNVSNLKSEKVGDWAVTYSDSDAKLSDKSLASLASYRRLSRSI